MKKALFVCGMLMFLLHDTAIASTCEQKKESIAKVLLEGSGVLRKRMEDVQGLTVLSPETKESFRMEADWVIAWLQDQAKILVERGECENIPNLIAAVQIQWFPIVLHSYRIDAKFLDWHVNRRETILENVPDEFVNAKALLDEVESSESITGSRAGLRKAVFLLRTGLRKLRTDGKVE